MPDVPGSVPPRRDLAISPLPPPVQRENGFDAAHSAGLFIGVNHFNIDRNLAPIPYAVDDAVDLAWTFAAELNLVPFDQLILCLGGAPRKPETAERLERLREAGATCHGGSRTEIGLALVEFADLARPEGLMVASVSTHGFEVGGAHYFLATDSARRIAAESAIPVATLKRELLRPVGVRRRLLLVDTCRERLDTGEVKRVGGGLNPSLAAELGKAEGFASLFATVAEGYSYDDPVAGNGVFTAGVLRGLRGDAPTDDGGFLRVGALAGYVDQHVRGWIRANNPHVGHPPGITRNMESDAESLPLAFDETKWAQRREATARARAEEQARRAAVEAQRRTAEGAVAERIRQARQRIAAAAAVDDAVADRLGAITGALRDWPADRRHRLLTEIEAMDPDNPRLRHYFTEVAWKQLAPDWCPAPSSSRTAAPKMVEVKPPEPPKVVYTPPPSPPSPPPVQTVVQPPPQRVAPAPKPARRPLSTGAKAAIGVVLLVVGIIASVVVYDAVRPARKIIVDSLPTPSLNPTTRPTPEPTPRATPIPPTPVPTSISSMQSIPSITRPGSKAGDRATMTINGVEFAFIWCPPGTFKMGSPVSDHFASASERPQTDVTLTRGFWMGETEVTQRQWRAVMGAVNNPSKFKGDTLAVESVSWNEVMGEQPSGQPQPRPGSFMARLREASEGRPNFSLPTEAQWEYACRAGTTTRFYFGDGESALSSHAWFDNNSQSSPKPVGSKMANPWGLHDMHGNVWEFTSSWFGNYPGKSEQDYSGAESGSHRVIRGGSWGSDAARCRSALRDSYPPSILLTYIGFRIVVLGQ